MNTRPTPRDQPFQGGNIGYADIVRDPKLEHCATCGTSWPCEVGQALKIVEMMLVWLRSGWRSVGANNVADGEHIGG